MTSNPGWPRGAGGLLALVLALGLVGCSPTAAPGESARPGAASVPAASGSPAAPVGASTGGSTAAAPVLPKVRIASTAVAASVSPLWLAKDLGIYERNGL